MIHIHLEKDKYYYDIHSLVKAFYPEQIVERAEIAPREQTENDTDNNDITTTLYHAEKDEISITILQLKNNDLTINIRFPEDNGREAGATGGAAVNASTNGSADSADTVKNRLKQHLYRALSSISGHTLPWGALTGIRPTKIATQMLADGKDDNTIIDYLNNVHFVSDEKARLSIEIAKREREILGAFDFSSGYSLYVGIPFCPTRCSYCSFAAYPLKQAGKASASHPDRTEYLKTRYASMVERYLTCLERELLETAAMMRGVRLDTVYIGGGTPTSLNVPQLERLLRTLRDLFDFSAVREFTVEAGRPDSILDQIGKLMTLQEYGVDRICVNPQSMRQKTLDLIGRGHTVEQTQEAFHLARDAGFDNINMDIILGLPGETAEDVQYTLERITKLAPDDLTVHSLSLKRGSRMHAAAYEESTSEAEAVRRKQMVSAKEAAEMSRIASEGARAMGLFPYYLYRQKNMTGNMENTGFARPGKEGLTNMLGMEEVHSIVACGAGAVTKRVYQAPSGHPESGLIRRTGNVRELEQYIARIDEMIERKRTLFSEESVSVSY